MVFTAILTTGYLYIDILYYGFVLVFGPGLLCWLSIFRPKRLRLLDQYKQTAVSCRGLITDLRVTIIKGNSRGMERGRHYKFRYAYVPPGSDFLYIKGYLVVPKQVCLQTRVLDICVLPGQPESGVPRFKITEKQMEGATLAVLAISSLSVTMFSMYLFSVLYAFFIHCGIGMADQCHIGWDSIAESVCTIVAIGYFGAQGLFLSSHDEVPGKVWKQVPVDDSTQQQTTTPNPDYLNLDAREIPLTDVLGLLEATEGQEQQIDGDEEVNAVTLDSTHGKEHEVEGHATSMNPVIKEYEPKEHESNHFSPTAMVLELI